MCGIGGIINSSGAAVAVEDLRRIASALAHRGPDGEGLWENQDSTCGFVHRRLAIIDTTPGSAQPMTSSGGDFTIVFNGEIYNFIELRNKLEHLGSKFRTEGDTEVIIEAWRHWGSAMLSRFNGMWAFAIYDHKNGETILARDRFGIKPLYYMQSGGVFAFASETKALRCLPWFNRVINLPAMRRTIFDPFSIEASEETIFSSIQKIPAGHICTIGRNGKIKIERWWRTLDYLESPPKYNHQRTEKFRELFFDSVRLRMRSDVSIGTCLSGGFDSSAVVSAMAQLAERDSKRPREAKDWRKAFIASFPGSSQDESPQALLAAKYARVNPQLITVGDTDSTEDIDSILYNFEDIYISLPTAIWQTYRALRNTQTVVSLDGHGADELMGGYQKVGSTAFFLKNTAQWIGSCNQRNRFFLDSLKATMTTYVGANFLRGYAYTAPDPIVNPFEKDAVGIAMDVRNQRLYDMFHANLLPMILRNFDRLSMAHGIEVRMPFMDWRLVTYVMSLPADAKLGWRQNKLIAREAMKGFMPEEIRVSKRKVGFNSPMPEWLNGALGEWALRILYRPNAMFDEIVDTKRLINRITYLNANKSWNWMLCGKLWPYIHMRWFVEGL